MYAVEQYDALRNSGNSNVYFNICINLINKDQKYFEKMSSDSESKVVVAGSSAEDIV